MRFIHTADIHLGAAPDAGFPWSRKREEEIWETFRRLLDQAEEEQADLLLIAGDLFHRQPLLRELKEVDYLFSRLTHTRVVLIAGNHDYIKKGSFYEGFHWGANVTFLDSADCSRAVFDELHTAVYGLSYHSREITEPLYDGLTPGSGSCFKILLAHGGDAKHIPIDKKRLQASGFDYIALGHIHKPQSLIRNRMIYAGALEPIDRDDTGPHGYIRGICENGRLETAFIPLSQREYRILEIPVQETDTELSVEDRAKAAVLASGSHHIHRIRLAGFRSPEITFRPERLQRLGNIIEVIDATEPAYDYPKLLKQHEGDILGAYIQRIYTPDMTPVQKRALALGVQALQQ